MTTTKGGRDGWREGGREGGREGATHLFFPFRHRKVITQVDTPQFLGEVPLAGFRDRINPRLVEILLGREGGREGD